MQTIDEVREQCRFVGERIEKAVADGVELGGAKAIQPGFATMQRKVYAA